MWMARLCALVIEARMDRVQAGPLQTVCSGNAALPISIVINHQLLIIIPSAHGHNFQAMVIGKVPMSMCSHEVYTMPSWPQDWEILFYSVHNYCRLNQKRQAARQWRLRWH